MEVTPHVSERYEVGAILENQWGYDQTNIDYYCIVKRSENAKGQIWLTLVEMTVGESYETHWMQGKCMAGVIREGAKPFRRLLRVWDGSERGVGIESYGWCSLWDGKPSHWTAYA